MLLFCTTIRSVKGELVYLIKSISEEGLNYDFFIFVVLIIADYL